MSTNLEKKFGFFSKMFQFGIGNIFISLDFFVAFLVLILLFIDNHFNLKIFISIAEERNAYVQVILSASSILFALITTALSIILSFSTSNFIKFLKKKDMLDSVLFPFWLGNAIYLFTIILSIVYLLLEPATWIKIIPFLFMFIIFLFIYAIGITFSLLRTIIRIGEWIAQNDEDLA
ncbi:MAG: hypothetical protein WC025_00395 [Candidatus Magasanikbacteria bacterium]